MPAVIFSHGFGGNYQVGTQYAEALAGKGYVVYCFDFCGESPGSRSDGSTLEMSIFTEQADLETIIRMMQEQPFMDEENIFLMGTSQGGAVSAITAAANKEEIKGAILLYPAFVLVDHAKEQFENVEEIPDTYYLMWMTVGRVYAEKLLDYDIYKAISAYDKDVLLIHGDADDIVPLSYSERAAEIYDSARLEVLPGAGHGFYESDAERAVTRILEYLEAHTLSYENSSYESVEGTQIKMITENTEVVIMLNDSRAAADLAAMLPLELTLIERNNFAKGMTLPEHLSSAEETTRQYEIGDFGYWDDGSDLAIFYDDIYEQTIVEVMVIPLGHAESGAETMAGEAGKVRLELVDDKEQTEKIKISKRRIHIMKKIFTMLFAVIITVSLAACSSDEQNSVSEGVIERPQKSSGENQTAEDSNDSDHQNSGNNQTGESGGSKILITYFTVPETDGVDTVANASRVAKDGKVIGNTEFIASIIQETLGGDLFAIETEQKYPGSHDPLLEFAYNEKSDDARPKFSSHIENLSEYDVVFVGFPNWNADLPMPLYTFFEEYDFSGKILIPFVTHGGSGFSSTILTIKELEPDATVVEEGLSVSRNNVAKAEDDVKSWAESLVKD